MGSRISKKGKNRRSQSIAYSSCIDRCIVVVVLELTIFFFFFRLDSGLKR